MSFLRVPKTEIRFSKRIASSICFVSMLLLAGCTVGPNYRRPAAEVPATYKEVGDWKPAQPNEQNLGGNWWELFQDPQLNSLELQVDVSNQNLKAAQAQYTQARALVRYSRADLFPTVTVDPSATRIKNLQQPSASQLNLQWHYVPTIFKFLSSSPTSSTFGDACAAPSSPLATRHKPAQPTSPP